MPTGMVGCNKKMVCLTVAVITTGISNGGCNNSWYVLLWV